jgi:hypothetical protein
VQVGGVEWFHKETRGTKALTSPAWKDPAKTVTVLHNLFVREYDRSLPAGYPGLTELGLRGRPRPAMIPSGCSHLSLTYQVTILPSPFVLHHAKVRARSPTDESNPWMIRSCASRQLLWYKGRVCMRDRLQAV